MTLARLWSGVSAHLFSFGTLTCALAVAVLFSISGASGAIDESLRILRERTVDRPASGAIHIVEIDAASIKALDSWPWPRSVHAQLIDRLRAAGARTIAFDVDFSAPSKRSQDDALSNALKRASGGVILPTFRQRTGGAQGGYLENLPIAPLRGNAILASVNVQPDLDGVMRTFSYGTVTGGVPRPSMAAMLAGANGKVGESFPVSTAIDPDTLMRHSAADVLSGKVGGRALSGKTVLVGATAIELGDRYATPRYGVQPGVVIQALAAETLLQDLVRPSWGSWLPLVIAAIGLILALRARQTGKAIPIAAFFALLLLLLPLGLELGGLGTVDLGMALPAILGGLAVIVLGDVVTRFNTLRLVESETGLPNERALRGLIARQRHGFVVVMLIRNYTEIATLLGENDRKSLMQQAATRIVLASGRHGAHSLGGGRLAWPMGDTDLAQLTETLDGLSALFVSRIAIGSQRLIASPVFGIAPVDDDNTAEVVSRAALAGSQAARANSRWMLYGAEMSDNAGRAQRLLADLDDALAKGDIFALFQPKWSIAKKRIDGVEALVRWSHPSLGPIPTEQFIGVLEQNGRMADLTLHMVDACTKLQRRWLRDERDVRIAINISAPLFSDNGFVAALVLRMADLGPIAAMMVIEVTESAIVLDDSAMIDALKQLRAMGVRISIDDYGTGQSTLSYLKKFPADEIKIDKSFVTGMLSEANDQILVRSTIEMAQELGFLVVAEGVEDEACFTRLAAFGCDSIQGWHIGRPMAADAIEMLLDTPASAAGKTDGIRLAA
jgi:diguanylate cyclase